MSRPWSAVLLIVAGISAGTYGLIRYFNNRGVPEVGHKIPDFRAANLRTGDSVTLKGAYAGQVVLVNIWATWCPPCVTEMPAIEALYQGLKDQGLKIAAVSIDEVESKDVMDFVNRLGLTFDILQRGDGSIQELFETTGYPESLLIDSRGTIVKKIMGAHPWNSAANRQLIGQLLRERPKVTAATSPGDAGG